MTADIGGPLGVPSERLEPDGDRDLRAFLRRVRRRWFVQVALRTVARAAGAAGAAGLAVVAAYWVVQPEGPALVLLAIAGLLASTAAAAIVFRQMHPRPSDRQVARFVEERAAQLPGVAPFDDALVSAVDDDALRAPGLRRLLVDAAERRVRALSHSQLIPPAAIRRAGAEALAGAVVLVVTLIVSTTPLSRAADAARLIFFPATVRVEVHPGDARVVAGQPLTIRAVVRAGDGTISNLTPSLIVTSGAEHRTVAMAPAEEGFSFAFESVDRTFTYRVSAGSASSASHIVTALFPPRVRRIDVLYEYPAFTGLRPRLDEDAGDIYGPAGTKVRVLIHADKPIASGVLAFEGAPASPLRGAGGRALETDLVLRRDDSYRVALEDVDGLKSSGGTEYFVRLMDDRPPDVRILRPAGDQQITPLEEVVIEARADDDHGISRFELVYAVPGRETKRVPFGRTSGSDVTKLGAHLLFAEDLRVQPGDVITYYASAVDVGRGKRPTEARSDMYFLEVRPFNEEFVAAQSQAGGGVTGGQIEGLIAAQKEIISATWNVERRSNAGRSSGDIKAIAEAQIELKARAEKMLSRGLRGRSPFRFPQQVAPRPGRGGQGSGEGIQTAVQAMARALEQLQGERTKEALPHQMAALQALLQAQAEVRRREVLQQQAAGGSGGSGRQGQDLSALFDKELQRQQRTNYETRSQIDERPDRSERDDALERIRDLARRQEDLSRRQRELAQSDAAAEEKTRQLERLTREQMELQQQVEQLAREMGQQANQQPSSRPSQEGRRGGQGRGATDPDAQQGGDRQGASSMRQVAEEMQNAAGDLARQDLTSAADRGGRAADDLRQIEQRMRGSSADARARAGGELRLEAQQIADEQRRIAAEVERMQRGNPDANADARRRLAGEKDRLADRADGLRRGASELAKAQERAGQKAEQTRVGEAARELDRLQLGDRMRETARELRESGAPAAEAERRIARGLDRVVEQLGGAGPESRNLSSALDETRSIRERLDRLERELREAEAGQRQPQSGAAGNRGQPSEANPQASPAGAGQLERLREEYGRELQQARDSLGRMEQSAPRAGLGGSTPEREERSQAAPGHEASKQDFSGWESLRKDVNLALERQEASVSARMADQRGQDRLSAGGSERVPDAYRALVARYYEALARVKK